ncbi:MAG TPA: hypothetical protein VKY32_10240 [Flavobacterium sp.]|nr:hypothetical protein [Flavobacterium sp.]
MKRLFLLSLLFANISVVFAQEITIEADMTETKFERTLKIFEGYTYYDFEFVTEEGVTLDIEIIEKEFVNGKLEKEKVYFDSKNMPTALKSNAVPVTILAKSISDDTYKMLYRFYNAQTISRLFDLNREDMYDFKIFVGMGGKYTFDKTYLFSAIVKPIKISENTYRDCDFSLEMDKYDQWYEIFGIDRYFVYEIKFYKG